MHGIEEFIMTDMYPDGSPGWSNGFLKRCAKVKKLIFFQRVLRWIRNMSKIKFVIIVIMMLLISSCDYQNNKLITEQATTFEQELSFRQRKEIELKNDIQKKQEYINKLERMLECKDGEKK